MDDRFRNGLRRGPLTGLLATVATFLVNPAGATPLLPSLGEDIAHCFDEGPLLVAGTGSLLSVAAFVAEDPAGHAGLLGHGFLEDGAELCDAAFGWPLLGGVAALWAGGSLAGDPETEMTGQELTEGILLTYGTAGILKLGIGRIRPDGGEGSFPSVHAAGTACAAVILWDRWGASAGIPAAAVAGFTALSRVALGRHYPSDVIAGAALGLAVGLAVVEAHEAEAQPDAPAPVLWLCWDTRNGLGVRI